MCVGDGLPAQVCGQCIHKVATSYEFKLLCERSDAKLRCYMRNSINIFPPCPSEVSRLSELYITSAFQTKYVYNPLNIKSIYSY
jgi:hypothetical protein